MGNELYNLFCILEGKNECVRVPKNIFMAKDYTNAKLYFQGYIYDEKSPENFTLYKIGSMDKKLKFKECKIFITGGFEITQKQKSEQEKIEQKKLNLKTYYNCIERAKEKKEQAEIIEAIFGGNKIGK